MNRLKKAFLIIAGCYLLLWSLTWLVSPAVTRLLLADLLAPHKIELDNNSTVRLNLLSSCVTIEGLIWRKDQQLAFELDSLEACYSLHRLVFSEARLRRLTLTGLTTEVLLKDNTFSIAGVELGSSSEQAPADASEQTAQPAPNPQGRRFGLAVAAPEVVLNDIHIDLQHHDQSHDVHIEQLQIVRSTYQDEVLQSELELLLTLNDARLDFAAAVVYEPLQSTGTFSIQLADFNPAPYQYLLPENLGQLSALVDIDLNLDVTRKGDIFEINSDSSAITVAQANYADDEMEADLARLLLELNELSTTLSIDAATELQVASGFDLSLNGVELALTDGSGQLLSLNELALEQSTLSLVGEKLFVELPELTLAELTASTRQLDEQNQLAPLLKLDALTVSGTQLTESAVAIDEVGIGEILVQAKRDEQGQLLSLVLPQQPTSEAEEQETQTMESSATEANGEPVAAEPSQAFAFSLGKLSLDTPAQIQFNDASIKPVLAKTLFIEQLNVTGVNTAKPEQKTDVQLKLKDDDYFSYQLSAQVALFGDKLDATFDTKATEFPLNEISPYVRSQLGFDILAGQLDVAAAGAIEQNMLDTELVAMLRGASFDSGDGDTNKDESSSIGSAVSLDMALGMLKDDDGNIELTIPVTGDVAAPDFGMQYVFGLVVQRAVMSQAQNFLLFAFAPYAHVIKVGMVAGSMALEVSFEDLPYAPKQIEPAEPQASFIEQFHALMSEKESLQVKVCGVASGSELGLAADSKVTDSQREQLLKLAEQRAAGFKKAVVKKGVESSRLLLCVPSYELKTDAKPRLKLSV
ncbi:DUF748 domain-containing protein [Neiella sp. HB171785]|uniref:DUF748 domain-containing protein n=1 Tax=Neiella litorisoli TaxID=2771431 RepID=A0A8J6UQH0_9GAMM|nr:DUF748 domain-containing protein [Neiella litorisoli]MBD1391262.1 DUF748 domain-containing protein [Neiella litorisoli]